MTLSKEHRFYGRLPPEARGFALLPEDIDQLEFNGSSADLFKRLQRPWLWRAGKPSIGKAPQEALKDEDFSGLTIDQMLTSTDGSTKFIFRTYDDHLIEAVHMPRDVKNPRVTFCISSQIGCAMGCTFCATGRMGLKRNLSAHEIVSQVLMMMAELGPNSGTLLTIVFMGMGEPLHNYDAVFRSIKIMTHQKGLGIPEKRITVSTSGLAPMIDRLNQEDVRPLLALSVNAPTNAKRKETMPITEQYDLERLHQSLSEWRLRGRERITLEYVLIREQNDTREDARHLANFARTLSHMINLIPLNEHGLSNFKRADDQRLDDFCNWLFEEGVKFTVRYSRGQDIGGACGQLVQIK